MIDQNRGRLYQLLWLVAICVEFPVNMVARINGHPEWNRHVMYRALSEGYLELFRGQFHKKVIKSLRITPKGIDYIGVKDYTLVPLIAQNMDRYYQSHSGLDKVMLYHNHAVAMVMAANAGAHFLPDDKPAINLGGKAESIPIDPMASYYYSAWEVRRVMRAVSPHTTPKVSRLEGIIIHGEHCYLIYYAGSHQMHWYYGTEKNLESTIDTTLNQRGFRVRTYHQIVIGSTFTVAKRICGHPVDEHGRYYSVSSDYASCNFIMNNAQGDELLAMIIDPERTRDVTRSILRNYKVPEVRSRDYDAVTLDGLQPVIVNYQFDMLSLLETPLSIYGFRYSPIILCYEYQAQAIREIVDAQLEVRTIAGGDYERTPTEGTGPP